MNSTPENDPAPERVETTGSTDALPIAPSLGIALEDMAFGELIYQKALAQGMGRRI